jgi:hypothetical protein
MPEPEDSKVPAKVAPTPHNHDHNHDHDHSHHYRWHHPLLIAAGATVVLVLLVATAAVHREMQTGFGPKPYMMGARGVDAGVPNTQVTYGSRIGGSNQSRLEGVVTKVDGGTLTIAGGGATNTVQTSGSTQYTNATAAKVNDTVIVAGTISNSTFTATQIVVNP